MQMTWHLFISNSPLMANACQMRSRWDLWIPIMWRSKFSRIRIPLMKNTVFSVGKISFEWDIFPMNQAVPMEVADSEWPSMGHSEYSKSEVLTHWIRTSIWNLHAFSALFTLLECPHIGHTTNVWVWGRRMKWVGGITTSLSPYI